MDVTSDPSGPASLRKLISGYSLAAAGPITVAGANFLLSFSILRLESAQAFGSFTFLFVAAAFMISLAGALFAAPMQALFSADAAIVAIVLRATTLVMMVILPAYVALGLQFGLTTPAAISYGVFAALTILRTVGRAWCYTMERPRRVTLSDIAYAVATLLIFVGSMAIGHLAPDRAVYPALMGGTVSASAVLGRDFAVQLWRARRARLSAYRTIWMGQSRWSLLAVSANELAANAHIYLLTLFVGTATVAPVAAGALLLRPVNVVQNALVEFERARMARSLSRGARTEVDRSVRAFRTAVLLAWLGTIGLAGMLLLFRPELVIPQHYKHGDVYLATTLWALVWLVIAIQLPLNVLLQAADRFSILSRASVTAAIISVAGVLIAITVGRPIWTIAALIPGWLVSTAIIRRAVRTMRMPRAG